jgi:SAM-dependent methyltransferase
MMNCAEFDYFAAQYDAALNQGISLSGENKDYFAHRRIAWLSSWLSTQPDKINSVLDFGCGTGSATRHLFDLLAPEAVLGADISQQSLNIAARLHQEESRARFVSLDQYEPNEKYDLAFCNGVFHHIPPAERAVAIDYIYRSLLPGGVFSFWENNPWNPATLYVMSRCPFDRDAETLTPPEARSLLQAGGFEVIQTDFLFIFPRMLRWLRGIEPLVARLPLGTQYQVLCRKS